MQEEVDKVLQRAHWDEEGELWVLERLGDVNPAASFSNSGSGYYDGPSGSARGNKGSSKPLQGICGVTAGSCRPIAVLGAKWPTSNFTKQAAISGDMNPRYR